MIRQTFLDRSTEERMDLHIERIEPEPVRPIRAEELETNLRRASANVAGTARRFLGWTKSLTPHPNQLTSIGAAYGNSGGSPDHLMYFGYWQVAPGEALVLRVRLAECDYWNFQACTWWMENFDSYEDDRGYITKRTAKLEPDGTVVLVLAHEDPGFGNHIDLFGHDHGTMNLRFVHPRGEAGITSELVQLAR
jgi:hypothetical protein